MELDNKLRGLEGIVISVREIGDAQVRVTIDDVENSRGNTSADWQHRTFVSSKDYPKESFQSLDFSEAEFASLGHYVLARLKAIHG